MHMPGPKVKATYSELVLVLTGFAILFGPILLVPYAATGNAWALLFALPFVLCIGMAVYDMIKEGSIGVSRE